MILTAEAVISQFKCGYFYLSVIITEIAVQCFDNECRKSLKKKTHFAIKVNVMMTCNITLMSLVLQRFGTYMYSGIDV